jgi:hypothetical protein
VGLPSHATFTDNRNGTGMFRFIPTMTEIGPHSLLFKATDLTNSAIIDSQRVRINVISTGLHPPVFDSMQISYILLPDSLFTLSMRATDPDNQSLVIGHLDSLPPGLVFVDSGNNSASISWLPDTSLEGIYNIRFTATDSTARSDTLHLQLQVFKWRRGDVNGDGEVRGSDVIYFVAYFKGTVPAPRPLICADANGDGYVNGNDVQYLVRYFKGFGPPPPPPRLPHPGNNIVDQDSTPSGIDH